MECVVLSGLGGFLWLWTLPEHNSYTVSPGNLCSWRGKLVVLSVSGALRWPGLLCAVAALCGHCREQESEPGLVFCDNCWLLGITVLMWFWFHSRLCPSVCVYDPDLFLVLMDLKVTQGYFRRLNTPTAGFKHSCAVMSPWCGG